MLYSQRVKELQRQLKSLMGWTDLQMLNWWHTPNEELKGLIPDDLSRICQGFDQLKQYILYSKRPIKLSPELKNKNSDDLP